MADQLYVLLDAATIFTSEWLNHEFIYNRWLIQKWKLSGLFEIIFVSETNWKTVTGKNKKSLFSDIYLTVNSCQVIFPGNKNLFWLFWNLTTFILHSNVLDLVWWLIWLWKTPSSELGPRWHSIQTTHSVSGTRHIFNISIAVSNFLFRTENQWK